MKNPRGSTKCLLPTYYFHRLTVVAQREVAGWTYVAATLESILTLAYYIYRFSGTNSRDE